MQVPMDYALWFGDTLVVVQKAANDILACEWIASWEECTIRLRNANMAVACFIYIAQILNVETCTFILQSIKHHHIFHSPVWEKELEPMRVFTTQNLNARLDSHSRLQGC